MANFSSLQDLYSVAPTMGAFMGGQRFAGEQEASNLANVAAQQKIEHDAQMNPLNAQYRQGEIAQQAAQLPGHQADSTLKQNKATIDTATLGQQLQAKQSELATKMDADQLARTRVLGEKMGALGAALQNVPPAARASMIAQQAQAMGVDINSPYVQTFLKAPPDQMPKLLQDTAQRMALATGDHQRKMHEVTTKEAGDTERAKILANARVQGASISADSRVPDLDTQFNKLTSPDAKYAQAVKNYISLKDTNPQEAYRWYDVAAGLKSQVDARTAAKAGSVDNSQLGLGTNPHPKAELPPDPRKPAPAPTPQGQVTGHEYMTRAPKEWGPMDTTKYEYAVINGKLARKPK